MCECEHSLECAETASRAQNRFGKINQLIVLRHLSNKTVARLVPSVSEFDAFVCFKSL